jgi:hypothetical protein
MAQAFSTWLVAQRAYPGWHCGSGLGCGTLCAAVTTYPTHNAKSVPFVPGLLFAEEGWNTALHVFQNSTIKERHETYF